ncbi:MAG: SH3 domain-containing protein [Burkholderiales bacterium]|nr:SH3 domain-containing protein [Burkholderiales bacterium]
MMRTLLTGMALLFCQGVLVAAAADFRSAAEAAVVLYDAPSVKARKLYIVNRGYPLEVVVQVEGWLKVRDAAGALSWAEAKTLDNARSVLLKTAATVRQKPVADAPVAFEAQRDLLLDLLEDANAGWLHVRHRDGTAGYVRAVDVWGG